MKALKNFKKLFLLVLTLSCTIKSFGETPFIYSDSTSKILIGNYLYILEDKEGKLTFSDIQNSKNFIQSKLEVPNLDVSSSSFWVKFSVKNETQNKNLFIELAYPLVDSIEFYNPESDGTYKVIYAGDKYPFAQRKYSHQSFIFDLKIPQHTTKTFYLRVQAGEQLLLPISVTSPEKLAESINSRDMIFGIAFGILFVMIFYNLFLFFIIKDRSYLFYVAYILFFGLMQAVLTGYTYRFLWKGSPWFTNQSIIIFPSLAGIFAIAFLTNFLQTKSFTPTLHKIIPFFIVPYSVAVLLSLFDYHNQSYKMIDVTALGLSSFIVYIAFQIAKKGYRPAKIFLIAWIILLVGVTIFSLRNLGLLPYNNFTNYTLQAGSALEVILLSIALADRINIFKKEKEESQQRALAALKENERIISERNVTLDLMVKERTIELQKSNEDLEVALSDLKNTQSQLVNSEKMASLGQLTAGVAHEINNPINFVSSSIKPLKRDIGDLLNILSKYEELNEVNLKDKVKEINDLKAELDIDYVKEEIDSLLKGIDDGATRTAEIVKGLKTFSRIDETDLKRVDLNEGIDSTLILLNSMMNGKIQVIKEYGEIAKIECYAGRINQVFMNILTNAIHAVLNNPLNENNGTISIKTSDTANTVLISIKDNGMGIPEEIKNKIFDPFFTTKDVGEGTGLGLSIVYNIIENHNGKISLQSEQGKGTEFIIELPKLQVAKL